jgi:hypothetical protein
MRVHPHISGHLPQPRREFAERGRLLLVLEHGGIQAPGGILQAIGA